MSFGGGFFGGGEKKTTTTVTSTSFASDLRTAIEGGVSGSTVLGPKATAGAAGGITTSVGDYSPLSQSITGNKFKIGMSGAEVRELMTQQALSAAGSLGRVTDFGAKALDAVTAAKVGESSGFERFIPIVVIGLVAFMAVRRR